MENISFAFEETKPQIDEKENDSLLMELIKHLSPDTHAYAIRYGSNVEVPEFVKSRFPNTEATKVNGLVAYISEIVENENNTDLDMRLPHHYTAIVTSDKPLNTTSNPQYVADLVEMTNTAYWCEETRDIVLRQFDTLTLMDRSTEGTEVSIYSSSDRALSKAFMEDMHRKFNFETTEDPYQI